MVTKWAKINLQTSFRPIWNPENQGYKIGYEKSYQEQQLRPKNGSEKSVRLLSADTVYVDLTTQQSTSELNIGHFEPICDL